MAYNETVNININADTSDVDNLEKSLSKQENRIKTLDGAINVLGGSVEILAGGLALSGALSDEQAEKFEGAAIGAIALADGAKRVMDGYKSLSESTKILTIAQRIYNTVMAANPVFLIVGVLAAVTAGVIALANATARNRKEQEEYNKVIEQANKGQKFYNQQIALAQAEGESQLVILSLQAQAQRIRVRGLNKELEALKAIKKPSDEQLERLEELPDLIEEAADAVEVAEAKVATEGKRIREQRAAEEEKARKEAADKRKAARDKQVAEEKAAQEEIAAAVLARYQAEIDAQASLEQQAALGLDAILNQQLTAQERELNAVRDKYFQLEEFYADDAETLKIITEQREKDVAAIEKKYNDQSVAATEKAKEKKDAITQQEADFRTVAITDSIDATQAALGLLFEENKGVASANVLIDAAQASVGIIKSAQNFKDPTGTLAIAYQVSQFALLAAVTAKSLQQINSAEPSGGGGGDTSSGGINIPSIGGGGGTGTSGIPAIPGFSTSGVQNLNAVVLSGDVTSAQAQDTAIRNRRRFG